MVKTTRIIFEFCINSRYEICNSVLHSVLFYDYYITVGLAVKGEPAVYFKRSLDCVKVLSVQQV